MVQFFDPTQEAKIRQRRMYAQMLQKGAAPRQTEVVGGYAVEQSPLEMLARGLQGGLGAYEGRKADEAEQSLAQSRQKLLAEALSKIDSDQKGAGAMLAQDPSMMAAGLGLITDANKTDRAQILADTEFRQRQALADEAAKNARIAAGIKAGTMGVDAEGNPTAPVGGGPVEKAQEVKRTAYDVATRLLENKSGVEANRGGISTMIPNISDSAVNAAADLDTLASLLTTENLGLLKGVLSDTDMKVLKDIGAGGLKGSDAQVLKNLADIKAKLGGQIGAPADSGPGKLIGTSGGKKVYQLPDGSHVMEQ